MINTPMHLSQSRALAGVPRTLAWTLAVMAAAVAQAVPASEGSVSPRPVSPCLVSAVPGGPPRANASSQGSRATGVALLCAHLEATGETRLVVKVDSPAVPKLPSTPRQNASTRDGLPEYQHVLVVELCGQPGASAGPLPLEALRGSRVIWRGLTQGEEAVSLVIPSAAFGHDNLLGIVTVPLGESLQGAGSILGVALPLFDPSDPQVTPPKPGAVVVTEFMKNPAAVTDARGEWLELENLSADPIDVEGWTLRDDGSNSTVITASTSGAGVVIQPGGFAVLGRNDDPALNGGVILDAVLSGFTLNNGSDQIVLEAPGQFEVDRVEYGDASWPTTPGRSASLSPRFIGTSVARDGAAWCDGSAPMPGGDLGSPGSTNPDCGG